jgi:hypothetical protein
VYIQGVSITLGQISGVSAKQYMATNGFLQPSRLSELNTSDFCMWGDLITLVCSAPTENEETHHHRIFDACQTIRNSLGTFERVRRSMIRHVHEYVDSGEGCFGHLF